MTTIMNHLDSFHSSHLNVDEDNNSNDSMWLSTYSRALCSLYPKDEDFLLNLQPTAFGNLAEETSSFAAPSLQSNHDSEEQSKYKYNQRQPYKYRSHSHSLTADMSNTYIRTNNKPAPSEVTATKEESADDVVERLRSPLSPGSRLSQMLCNIGFKCIDYFTPLDDEQAEETGSTAVEDQGGYWAADVYGKRTAALEKRRTLSRNSSSTSDDSWIDALERLGHWDETA
ncbi:hypothetical protein BGZ49_004531 [Haplosporangium sp. Z 27]|nr:hypothetical protein BGZ49_004531 [Haplosporangium sp. Z 27]